MSPTSVNDYLPLRLSVDDETKSDESESSAATTNTTTRSLLPIGFWSFIICLACTLSNLFITLFYQSQSVPATPPTSAKDIHLLRRPSQYIRLEDIARPSPPMPRQFNNYPILITQIDSAHGNKVFDDSIGAYMSRVGTITPEDRRVHISTTISSIIQFRAIDFGMEACELQLIIQPGSIATASSSAFMLNIYRLNATQPLDMKTISYDTLPPRVSKVGAVEIGEMKETGWHERFFCQSDEVLTFELACLPAVDEDGCRVEWWQNKADPQTAIFITQHATL